MARPPPLDLSHHLSEVSKNRKPSQIKQYYKFFQIPGIGNLAGGLPNVSFFPFDTLEAQTAKPTRWTPTPNHPTAIDPSPLPPADNDDASSLSSSSHITVPKTQPEEPDPSKKIDLATALQYGTAEGYPPLRSFVRQFTRDVLHPGCPYGGGGPEVILTCGSTDGMAKTLELLTNPWTEGRDDVSARQGLLCEVFMYSNVLAQAAPRGMNIAPVEIDDEGMLATGEGGLEDVLESWDEKKGRRPHLLYTVTMGHNPTSGVLSVKRRKELYAICSKYDVIIVEDDPYWYLQYPSAALAEARSRNLALPASEESPQEKPAAISSGYDFIDSLVPSYLSIDTDGRVIRLDTFSKTIAPGCRMGWITAQPDLIERLLRIAETSTQQPSGFVQSMVAQLTMGQQHQAVVRRFFSLSAARQRSFSGWSTDGWVRWLAGLRGSYERRMQRMCTILDEHAHALKQSRAANPTSSLADYAIVEKTRLLSFAWPRGGMFVWLRIHFENHPCWMARGPELGVIDGEKLSTALLVFLTRKPQLVLAAPGLMFSADAKVRKERGWAYYRLCFAAESEENVDRCSTRFAEGVQRFFRIKEVEKIEELLKDAGILEDEQRLMEEGVANLGTLMSC